MGWRLRLLVGCALFGCVGVFVLIRTVAQTPTIDATWRTASGSRAELIATSDPALAPHVGQALESISWGGIPVVIDALALQRSARWLVDDDDRARHRQVNRALAQVAEQPAVELTFADGASVRVAPVVQGLVRLPVMFWLLLALTLALYLVAVIVVLANPTSRNAVYALMAWAQAGNLAFIAMETAFTFGSPAWLESIDMPVRMAFDLTTAAAVVNATCLHPKRLPGTGWIAVGCWLFAAALVLAAFSGTLAHAWWWTQITVTVFGAKALGLLTWSYHIEAHPFAIVSRRLVTAALGTWIALTIVVAFATQAPERLLVLGDVGSTVWYVFVASLLLLIPFLARSRHFMREFAMLAAISTVATSLDLLFVAVFSIGQFASLTLSLFISLGVYAGVREWILNQLLGSSMLTTERMFEQLYRTAREVEVDPSGTAEALQRLLRDLFEPMQTSVVQRQLARTRLSGDGSSMLVPIPTLVEEAAPPAAVLLRFARHGRRLFSSEDARLTDRIVDQLRRAVDFDKAVERGRNEERLRLAQDLHDDIGARLLTLMYKAHSPEVEEYLRHTLQDLKTLTRGLAAPSHRLSHAGAEWKADLAQRLTAAQIELKWRFNFDDDVQLSIVQWSALTRVLRELVSNAIAHAQAHQVSIDFRLQNDHLDLVVCDDGVGAEPQAWSHGLGLSGVRKRVKQLSGEIDWLPSKPRGICCRVTIDGFRAKA